MADEQEQAQAPKKGNKTILIIIIALVLAIVLAAAAFFFLTSGGEQADPAAQQGTQATPTAPQPTATGTSYIKIGPVYQLDQFIVNLLTQSGRRYLKATIGLEMTTEALQSELDAKRGPVRDTIINILSSKSFEEISTTRGKEKLKEEIAQRLNEFLVDGKIRNVFLLDFAVQ